jgi:hypothetical protein
MVFPQPHQDRMVLLYQCKGCRRPMRALISSASRYVVENIGVVAEMAPDEAIDPVRVCSDSLTTDYLLDALNAMCDDETFEGLVEALTSARGDAAA